MLTWRRGLNKMIFWFAQNVAKKMDNTQLAATINSPQAPIQSEKRH